MVPILDRMTRLGAAKFILSREPVWTNRDPCSDLSLL